MIRVVLLLALVACHDLPALGTCGNGIAEQLHGEACDDGGDSATCTASCELRCTTSAVTRDYVAVAQTATGALYCPGADYRCGADQICRAPSGRFAPAEAALGFDITGSPVLGDLDGDGTPDLIGTSATSIVVRFGSTAGAPLATVTSQQAPSSDAPYAIFDLAGPHADPSVPATTIAVPTEGIALLGSDGQRFAPQLDLPIPVAGETAGLVVRDPDPALGDVVLTVASRGADGAIAVTRAAIDATPGVTEHALPPCTAPGARHTIAIEAAPDRRAFIVVTERDGDGPQPWHVCRYTQTTDWQVTDLELPAPAPSSVALGELDGDACLELAVHGDALGLAMLDAAGADCNFTTLAPLPIAGTAAPVLAAGAIVPGGHDELVLGNGVYRACATDCGASAPGTWLRVVTPAATWTTAALADLNGDGALDVVAARGGDADVDVVRGGATPNLYRADTADPVTFVVAGDFDGDRLGDVALVESSAPGDRISVLFGTRDATVGPPVAMSPVGGRLKLDVVHEVHWLPSTRGSDGIDDLLVLKTADTTAAGLLIGDAARLMTTPRFPPMATGQPLGAIAAGAFGSDDTELLAITGDQLQLYNAFANNWAPPVELGTALRSPVGALRDGTGHARAVARGTGDHDVLVVGVRGALSMCPITVDGTPRALRAIDLDRDGIDELAVLADGDQASLAIYDVRGCPATQLGAAALAGCIDAVHTGRGLVALCQVDGHPRGLFAISIDGAELTRAAEPFAITDGDARFVTAADFDGDGVLELVVGVSHGSAGLAIQRLRQCPQHDTRACP